jgi:predicted nucleic acid-binding protein
LILVDAGPLVALVDADDQHHRACATVMRKVAPPLLTVWPAVAEAMYILGEFRAQDALWQMLFRDVVALEPLQPADLKRARDLMAKYHDLPMDLADAALVAVAERREIRTIFTTDRRDFEVYRPRRVKLFEILP